MLENGILKIGNKLNKIMTESQKNRCNQLYNLNMAFDGKSYVGVHERNDDFNVHWTEIMTLSDEDWDALIEKLSNEFNDRIA